MHAVLKTTVLPLNYTSETLEKRDLHPLWLPIQSRFLFKIKSYILTGVEVNRLEYFTRLNSNNVKHDVFVRNASNKVQLSQKQQLPHLKLDPNHKPGTDLQLHIVLALVLNS